MADHETRGPAGDARECNGVARSDGDQPERSWQDELQRPNDDLIPQSPDSFRDRISCGRCFVALARLICAHNPFYLISACLALVGLNAAFKTSAEAADPWVLLGVLAGYTTLMAATALVIVRLGQVWEDARWLLLIVVLLFIAMSVSFDEIINQDVVEGSGLAGLGLMCCGFAFSALLSEGLLLGLRIRLGLLFRAPYYAVLGLFFGYPVFLRWLLQQTDRDTVLLGILAFPAVAAATFLLLIPAVRRGRAYVRQNGTPWAWPWFPWPLFMLLALGTCVRSYYLTLSFHGIPGMDSIFGLYFLVPFVFVAAVILLESGIVSGIAWLRDAALALPLLAVAMAFPGAVAGGHPYNDFVRIVLAAFGSPALIAAVGAGIFYAYACVRGVRFAPAGLVVALLLSAVIGRRAVDVASLSAPHVVPLMAAGLVEVWLAFRSRRSWHALLAAVFIAGGCATQLPGAWWRSAYGLIPAGMIYAAALLIGLFFHDRFARMLRVAVGVVHVPILILTLAYWEELAGATWGIAPWAAAAGAVVVPPVYGWLVKSEVALYAGVANAVVIGIHGASELYAFLNAAYGDDAVGPFFWSGASFVVAFIISLIKIKRIVRGVARRVVCLYRPAQAEETPAGPG